MALHWAMPLLLAAVYTCIEARGYFAKGSDTREALKTWHFLLGLLVLVLATLRLGVHLSGPMPRIHPQPPRWQSWASVAPAVVLVQRACWWKKPVKLAAVRALTSWMGLWFFLRDQRGSRSRLRRATSIRTS